MGCHPKPKKSKAASKSVLPVLPSEMKKRAAHPGLPPPTPREVKERSTKRISDKQRERIGRRFENSGSESEDSEDLPIISVKRTKQPLTTTPDAPIERTRTAVTDIDVGSDQDTIPARGGELDNHPRDQGTSNPGTSRILRPPVRRRELHQRKPGWFHTAARVIARTRPHPRRLEEADVRELRSLRWGA